MESCELGKGLNLNISLLNEKLLALKEHPIPGISYLQLIIYKQTCMHKMLLPATLQIPPSIRSSENIPCRITVINFCSITSARFYNNSRSLAYLL
jgi:hypothetical protein